MQNYLGTEFWCDEDLFLRDHLNPKRKRWEILIHFEILRFEHSGRFIVPPPPPQTVLLSYGHAQSQLYLTNLKLEY